MSVKNTLARKAAKAAAKHTAHGTASKLKRDPMRTATLLGLGHQVRLSPHGPVGTSLSCWGWRPGVSGGASFWSARRLRPA